MVTEAIEGVHRDLPILRDPDGYTYMKEEVGGLVVGGFEPTAKPWVAPDALPYPFEFQLLEEDWDHFEVLMESALHRIPALRHTGLKKLYNGPESFTPDNQFILGEAPDTAGVLRRGGVQLGRHRLGGRRRACPGRVDRRRRADERPRGGRHPPLRLLQRQQPLAQGPGGGGARPALRRAVAEPGVGHGPPFPALAPAPPPGRQGRGVRLEDGLGATERLRPAGSAGRARLHVGAPRVAGLVVRRARSHAPAGGRLRRDIVRQAARGRPRCRDGAAATVHGRRARWSRTGPSTPACSTSGPATRPT